MVKKQLLGPDGTPINSALLSQEVATPTVTGVRATHHLGIASGLTPESLAYILRKAQTGDARDYLTLAEEMEERYLHYASQVQTRRLSIEGVQPTIESPKDMDRRIVDAVHDLIDEPGLLDTIGELTDGIAKGYAVVEPVWEYERGFLRPVSYLPRDQRFFQFDRITQRELRLAVDGSRDGDEIAKATFIIHTPRSKAGIPIRRGFARPAAWAFMLQSFSLKDWAAFAEIYGVPLRLGKYHSSASATDKATLLRAVSAIAADAAAIIPQGMEIEFIEAKGNQGEAVFGGLLEYIDKQVSKLVVGQTMTADDGSSMAQAEVHNEVRIDIQRADCRQLANTLNRDLIRWFVALNFGPQDVYPQIALPVTEPEDIKQITDGVARLLPYGLKVGQSQMREKLGLSEPEEDDELLVPAVSTPAASPPADDPPPVEKPVQPPLKGRARTAALAAQAGFTHPVRCACAGCVALAGLSAEDPPPVDVERELETLMADGLQDWEALADPLFAPFRVALEQAGSFEELEAMLPQIAATMDGGQLAEALARLTTIARGLGDVSD